MTEEEYRALARVQFSTALGPDSIWRPQSYHVGDLHRSAAETIARAIELAVVRPQSVPTGYILNGDPGVGKTHLLGWVRQHVHDRDGYFFMPKLIDGESFWDGAVHGVVNRLTGADGGQLRRLLIQLCGQAGCDPVLTARIAGPVRPHPEDIDTFLDQLSGAEPQAVYEAGDTLRALVLFRAGGRQQDIADNFLTVHDGLDEPTVAEWGFRRGRRNPQLIFQDLVRLFALGGPVVVALDQIDALMSESDRADRAATVSIADSLMRLREETVRTIIIAACIPTTWRYIEQQSVASAADRFTVLELQTALPGPDVARAIVAGHLAAQYDEVGFTPAYPTWPVRESAFAGPVIAHSTPRAILQQVAAHVGRCLDRHAVSELAEFGAAREPGSPQPRVPMDPSAFDARFERLRHAADITTPLDPAKEDEAMVGLLDAGLRCFVLERRDEGFQLTIDQATTTGRALHARLRRTIDEILEVQEHWSFRAIAHPHHLGVQARLRSAVLESGVGTENGRRHLTILRNVAFSNGPKTTAMLDSLKAANGRTLPIAQDDLRTFSALREMLDEPAPGMDAWLALRRPAGGTQLFRKVFADLLETEARQPEHGAPASTRQTDTAPAGNATPTTDAEPVRPVAGTAADSLVLGRGTVDGREFRVPLEQLRKHLVVFAGSGSGKTVLLRRIIEEAALQGVSAIVVDPNNDLSRLGDPWPEDPAAWGPGDAERSARYLADTDVTVWTPRRSAGRPLVLNPLPDFAAVLDDQDELRQTVEAAAADLLPRAGATGRGQRGQDQARAVLIETLLYFARHGESTVEQLITLLSDLPDGVSRVRNASAIAAEMADGLTVARINDPLFGDDGESVDPGVLLTPPPGKRARVSVISCVGLPDAESRAMFVGRLQLALFTWFKRNPAGDRPLGALLVLDEAQIYAPSGKSTPATASTLLLAAQARKFGLGIAYATQAPKGLNNMVTGNTGTQFFGKLVAAVQIQAAKGIAQNWGGHLDDIAKLTSGHFYGASEGTGFRKLATPLCLSHHPPSPPTESEVIARAAGGRVVPVA